MSEALLAEFAQLYHEKLEAQDRLDMIAKRLAELQEPLLAYVAEQGWDKMPSLHGVSPYVHTQLWAKAHDGNTAAACLVMKADPDMGPFVHETFNVNTVSSYVRELRRKGEALSAAIAAVLDVDERVEIRARRS
mgnify:CR=1